MDTPLEGARHMKGKQVAVTLYLSPRKYWLLKALSHRHRVSMQKLLRQALEDVLREDSSPGAVYPATATLPDLAVSPTIEQKRTAHVPREIDSLGTAERPAPG